MNEPLFLYFSEADQEELRCAVFEAVRCILLEEFGEISPELRRRLRGAKQALLKLNMRLPPARLRPAWEPEPDEWTTLSRSRLLLSQAIERLTDEEEKTPYRRVMRALWWWVERR